MNKRGLSGVITIVLVILIVLVAIGIIWTFVQPAIVKILKDNFGDGGQGNVVECVKFSTEVVSCDDLGDGSYQVRVSRGKEESELTQLKFKFGTFGNDIFIIDQNDNLPSEYGTKTYTFDLTNYTSSDIRGVDIASVFGDNLCDFAGPVKCKDQDIGSYCGDGTCDVGENENNCPQDCGQQELQSCADQELTVVPLADFDLNSCTRTRNQLIDDNLEPLPSAGVRVVGQDWDNAATTGTTLGRNIVHWYQMYDENGELDLSGLNFTIEGYHNAGMKVILTLRANHPDKCEHSFDTSGRNLLQDDSWPKDEQEWKDYLQTIANVYYVNPAPEHAGTLAAIQIGNEWGHQFVINESYGRYSAGQEQEAIKDLMNFSYNAVKEVAPDLPVLAFAVSGTPGWALGDGWYDSGDEWTYDGIYYGHSSNRDNISIIYLGDVNQDTIAGIKDILVNGSEFYDYFDAHIYFQRPDEARYVANFIRNVWYENGIEKGLVSTEFANPIYNYSYNWHSYSLKAAQAVAYHSGFDTIVWGNWYPSPGSPNLLQASLRSDSGYQFSQVYNYTEFQDVTKDFNQVMRQGDLLTFDGKPFDLNENVPEYPSYYQCNDGIDNDNDGNIDDADGDCSDYYNLSINCNGVRVQNLQNGCIDPAGFSENNWIFCYDNDC